MDIAEVDLKTFLEQKKGSVENLVILLCDKENRKIEVIRLLGQVNNLGVRTKYFIKTVIPAAMRFKCVDEIVNFDTKEVKFILQYGNAENFIFTLEIMRKLKNVDLFFEYFVFENKHFCEKVCYEEEIRLTLTTNKTSYHNNITNFVNYSNGMLLKDCYYIDYNYLLI
jgi:hypothetical protein